jgi:hypothetical protein
VSRLTDLDPPRRALLVRLGDAPLDQVVHLGLEDTRHHLDWYAGPISDPKPVPQAQRSRDHSARQPRTSRTTQPLGRVTLAISPSTDRSHVCMSPWTLYCCPNGRLDTHAPTLDRRVDWSSRML